MFVPEIEWLLVVVTPNEITILGVVIDRNTNELSLLNTDIAVSTDGVLMTKVVGTDDGRIVLAGNDGVVHEINYVGLQSTVLSRFLGMGGKEGKSRLKRPRKVIHSPSSMLSSYIVPEALKKLLGHMARLDDIAYDDRRKCLYTLSSTGVVGLYRITKDEPGTQFDFISSVNALKDANRYARSVAGSEREIVSLFPTDSNTVHLIAVTSYGERLYYTTSSSSDAASIGATSGGNNSNSNSEATSATTKKVSGLRQIGWRPSAITNTSGLSASEDRPCIHVATWNDDSMLMSDLRESESDMLYGIFPQSRSAIPSRQRQEQMQKQLQYGRASSTAVRPYSGDSMYVEQVASVSLGLYGDKVRALDLASAVVKGERDGRGGALSLPNVKGSSFWVLTEREIILFERKSPIELLHAVVSSDVGDAEKFFFEHGVVESSAMCVELALTNPSVTANAARALYLYGDTSFSEDETLLKTKQEPALASTYQGRPQASRYGFGSIFNLAAFDVGRPASTHHTQGQFSGIHDGLALYLGKTLDSVWTRYILQSRDPKVYPKLSVEESVLTTVRGQLLSFLQFLDEYAPETMQKLLDKPDSVARDRTALNGALPHFGDQSFARGSLRSPSQRTPAPQGNLQDRLYKGLYKLRKVNEKRRLEQNAILGLKELAMRSAEALSLVGILSDHQLHRLLAIAPDDIRETLCSLRYCDLIVGDIGPYIASALLEALFASYTDEPSVISHIGQLLQERCSSYFGNDDQSLHQGLALLRQALKLHQDWIDRREESGGAGASVLEEYPQEAVMQKADDAAKVLSAVASRISDLRGICKMFAEIKAFLNLVVVALAVAQVAETIGNRQRAQSAYDIILDTLKPLFEATSQNAPNDELYDKVGARSAAIQAALSTGSEAFHDKLYEFLLKSSAGEMELLKHPSERIIKFFEKPGRERLLWRCLARQGRNTEAAQVLIRMAELENASSGASLKLSLSDRVNYLTCAVHNAKTAVSTGNSEAGAILSEASDLLDVAQVQMRLRDTLRGKDRTADTASMAEALNGKILDLSILYNEYARPLELWESALDILNCGDHDDDSLIAFIWEKLMEQESKPGVQAIVEERVAKLARLLYPGPAFPVPIVLRLLAQEAFARKWFHGILWSAMNNGGIPWGVTIDGFRALREISSWVMEEKLLWITKALLVGLDKTDVRGREREAAHELITSLKARLRATSARESRELIRKLDSAEQSWSSSDSYF